MRYISWVRSADEYGAPPQALQDAMGAAMEEAFKSGTMVQAGGLSTLKEGGLKLTLTDGKVTDGPYSEAKELVGGFAIQDFDTYEEAVESARWLLDLHKEHWPDWEGEVEVREMYGPDDF